MESLNIRAGEWDMQSERESFPHQDLRVRAVVVHERFNAESLANDYAILILTQPVELSETVNVICLPPQDMQINNSSCIASGWGKNIFGEKHCIEHINYTLLNLF